MDQVTFLIFSLPATARLLPIAQILREHAGLNLKEVQGGWTSSFRQASKPEMRRWEGRVPGKSILSLIPALRQAGCEVEVQNGDVTERNFCVICDRYHAVLISGLCRRCLDIAMVLQQDPKSATRILEGLKDPTLLKLINDGIQEGLKNPAAPDQNP